MITRNLIGFSPGRHLPDSRYRRCNGPEAGEQRCFRNSREMHVDGFGQDKKGTRVSRAGERGRASKVLQSMGFKLALYPPDGHVASFK